ASGAPQTALEAGDEARMAKPARRAAQRIGCTDGQRSDDSRLVSAPKARLHVTDLPANDAPFRLIDDVEFGEDVTVWSFSNLYGCQIGSHTRIGSFVEVQRGASIGAACKISSHSFICDGVEIEDEVFVGHGVLFVNDRFPRATTDDGALHEVTASAQYVLGARVERFEQEFAHFVGAEHAVGVGSGLDALRLGLLALEIGPGDEVIVPANTYIATALAVSEVGADVVLVDCDPATYNVDPDAVAAAVTSRTRALLPVHFSGQAAEMRPLLELVASNSLEVVEDAAQAHGTLYDGRPCGSLGKLACFSFY